MKQYREFILEEKLEAIEYMRKGLYTHNRGLCNIFQSYIYSKVLVKTRVGHFDMISLKCQLFPEFTQSVNYHHKCNREEGISNGGYCWTSTNIRVRHDFLDKLEKRIKDGAKIL